MNAFINAITDPRLLFMWFGFIFLALASLLLGMVEHWPWGAIFFVGGPVTLLALDMAHDESIAGKANGGPFHHFFIFVFSFSAVGLIVLTVLTAFGVLKGDTTPWTPETNFASWYIAAGSHIVLVLATRTNPKNGAPDLQRMEQLDRRSTRVGVVTAAIFAVLCLVVPLISLSATSYDSLALALTLLLTPWFLYFVRDGLFYLHHPRFEEGSEGYRTPACRVRRYGGDVLLHFVGVHGQHAEPFRVATRATFHGIDGDNWVAGEAVRHRGYHH